MLAGKLSILAFFYELSRIIFLILIKLIIGINT